MWDCRATAGRSRAAFAISTIVKYHARGMWTEGSSSQRQRMDCDVDAARGWKCGGTLHGSRCRLPRGDGRSWERGAATTITAYASAHLPSPQSVRPAPRPQRWPCIGATRPATVTTLLPLCHYGARLAIHHFRLARPVTLLSRYCSCLALRRPGRLSRLSPLFRSWRNSAASARQCMVSTL